MVIRIRKWFNYWISRDRSNAYAVLAVLFILLFWEPL